MSEYEVGRARGDQESQAIREGIENATSHDSGPWEFGHYIERYDGPLEEGFVPSKAVDGDWTPIVYEAPSLEFAEEEYRRLKDPATSAPFRRSRIVRRFVSPWEVFQ